MISSVNNGTTGRQSTTAKYVEFHLKSGEISFPSLITILFPVWGTRAVIIADHSVQHCYHYSGFKPFCNLIAFHPLPHRSSPCTLFCHYKFSDFFIPTRVHTPYFIQAIRFLFASQSYMEFSESKKRANKSASRRAFYSLEVHSLPSILYIYPHWVPWLSLHPFCPNHNQLLFCFCSRKEPTRIDMIYPHTLSPAPLPFLLSPSLKAKPTIPYPSKPKK